MTYAVVIAAYNAQETLRDALESVLAQTVPPQEIVVVDDGSTDATLRIAQGFDPDVKVISQQNQGPGAATNAAIAATGADIVAAIDADDIWLPHKMARQLSALTEAGPRTILFSQTRLFDHERGDDGTGRVRDGLLRSTMVLHRKVFETVGPIEDPPGGIGDMVDWFARAREEGFDLQILPEVLALRRIIATSMTYCDRQERARGYLETARRALARKKALKGSQ